jgi:uncharacterized protein DUF4197
MGIRTCALSALLLLSANFSLAQLGDIVRDLGLGQQSKLSDTKLTSGLKEALRVGADKSVKLTGRTDGYFANQAIKILVPKNLHPLETGLRAIGYGPKVDEFVLSMNRAAEAAAPQARKIFGDAILAMTFEDARKIFSGGDTAATDYFKSKTTEQLTAAFRPIIQKTMNANGVTQQYNTLVGQYKLIPFAKKQDMDIDNYVVTKALDGLFYTLGQQEKEIRKNPAARTTRLLKEVFGK